MNFPPQHFSRRLNKSGSSIGETLKGFANSAGSQLEGVKNRIGSLQLNPLNPADTAMMGGAGGAILGGGVGLLKSLLDNDEDGIMGAIRKALHGAAVGGVGGAALGGGYSALRRNQLLKQLPQEKQNGAIRTIMSNYSVPLGAELNRVMGGDPRKYDRPIQLMNTRSAVSSMVAPYVVRALEQKATQR